MITIAQKYVILDIFLTAALIVYLIFSINGNFKSEAERIYKNLEDYVSPILDASIEISDSNMYLNWIKSGEDEDLLEPIREKSIRETGAATMDIASAITGITYQAGGTKVLLDPENDRDYWYYSFIESDKNTSLELYYDSNSGILYLYYNVKIFDDDKLMGVVGFRIDYENMTNVLSDHSGNLTAYLVNSTGEIYLHDDQTQIGDIDIYDYYGLMQKSDNDTEQSELENRDNLTSIEYFPYLDSYLIVDYNLTIANLFKNMTFTLLVLITLLNILYAAGKVRQSVREKSA